jgi:hypothetical protein
MPFHDSTHAPLTNQAKLVQHNDFYFFRAWHRRFSAGLGYALLGRRPLPARRHDRYLL